MACVSCLCSLLQMSLAELLLGLLTLSSSDGCARRCSRAWTARDTSCSKEEAWLGDLSFDSLGLAVADRYSRTISDMK